MLGKDTAEKIWSFLVERIREECEGPRGKTGVAEKIGVTDATIGRWLKGSRGGRISLRRIAQVSNALCISTEEIAKAIDEPSLHFLMSLEGVNDEDVKRMEAIVRAGGKPLEMLLSQVEFIHSTIKTE